ncbi:MAG: transposase [Acidimicrobiales bacterium]
MAETWPRGLPARDVEDAFRDATGEPVLSLTALSEATDRLWEHCQAFIARGLSAIEAHCLFLGAIFEPLRAQGAKEALLVAWRADEGRKHLLHLAAGNKEPEAAWAELLGNLLSWGTSAPATVTSDGAPGLAKATEADYPQGTRARCWPHCLANMRPKLPDELAGEVAAHV